MLRRAVERVLEQHVSVHPPHARWLLVALRLGDPPWLPLQPRLPWAPKLHVLPVTQAVLPLHRWLPHLDELLPRFQPL